MKRWYWIVITLQVMVIVVLFFFGLTQRIEAESLAEKLQLVNGEAIELRIKVDQSRAEAERQKKIAELNAMEAMRQAGEARRQQQLNEELHRKQK
jgi:antitoxin component of MazEF toxin-antitoxin module